MEQLEKQQPKDGEMFPDGRCRLILIGKTGAGKSSTGNTIIGRDVFDAQCGLNSKTKECGFEETFIGDLKVMVMDTPGLADTEGLDEIIAQRITRSLCAMEPGPHAVLLCLRCERRFTSEEYRVIEALKYVFGKKMTDYMVTIFAGKDQLDSDIPFDEQLKGVEKLNALMEESNRRYVLFDNKADEAIKKQQVIQLLDKVSDVVRQNGGQCFLHKAAGDISDTMKVLVKEELRSKKREGESAGGEPADSAEKGKPEAENNADDHDQDESSVQQQEVQTRRRDLDALRRRGTVAERRKRFTIHSSNLPTASVRATQEEDEAKLSRRHSAPPRQSSAPTPANEDSRLEEAPPETTEDSSEKEDNKTEESVEKVSPDLDSWIDADPEMRELLADLPGDEGMTLEEKRRNEEDKFRHKIVKVPLEELTKVQQVLLETSSGSIRQKLQEGMSKFSVKAVDQCLVM